MTVARQWALFLTIFVIPPLALNAFALLQPWTEAKFLYRDPLLLAQNQFEWLRASPDNGDISCCAWWWGALSHVGILIWAATAGALALALGTLALRDGLTRDPAGFLAVACLLTALLAADDLFQLHEQNRLLGRLKGEALIYPLFAALLAGYAFFRVTLLTPYFPVLCLSVAFFGVSLLADQILPQNGGTVLIEDSAKLLGIFLWAGFHLMVAAEALVGRPVFLLAGSGDGDQPERSRLPSRAGAERHDPASHVHQS